MAHLLPPLRAKFFDTDGEPLASGKVYFYQAGTSTPLATYQDREEAAPNANPVVLDFNGEADIWLQDEAYKVVIKDSSDVVLKTIDNVRHINLASITREMLSEDVENLISEMIEEEVGSDTGHDHDGTNSQKVLATNLDSTGGSLNTVLTSDGNGGTVWGTAITAALRSVTSAGSTNALDDTVILSGSSFALTLHSPVGQAGKLLRIIHNGDSLSQSYVLVHGLIPIIGPQGNVTTGNYRLYTKGEMVLLQSDGSNWIVIQHNTNTGETLYFAPLRGSSGNPTHADFAQFGAYWSRQGDKMKIRFEHYHTAATGAANGSGVIYVDLPPSFPGFASSVTTFIDSGTSARGGLGHGGHWATGFGGQLHVRAYTSDTLCFMLTNMTNHYTQMTWTTSSYMAPLWSHSFTAEFPVDGFQP